MDEDHIYASITRKESAGADIMHLTTTHYAPNHYSLCT
jgi:hypothetical protein